MHFVTIKKVVVFNLLFVLILVLDFFILPQKQTKEVFDYVKEVHVSSTKLGSRSKGYVVEVIVAKSRNNYSIPYDVNVSLAKDDTFYMQKTFLLQLQSNIVYKSKNTWYTSSIGQINGNKIIHYIFGGTMLFSLLCLMLPKHVRIYFEKLAIVFTMFMYILFIASYFQ
jgi:hypothetical protein